MKIEITKEWCLRMAQREADAEIGAGLFALDPVFDGETSSVIETEEEPSIAFGRFVHLMRRQRGLTLEKLAEDTDVEIVELVEIEDDARHKPKLRTVYQLANYFRVPQTKLQQIAGLTVPRDSRLQEEAVRFAARSETVAALTPEENAALEAFIAVLSEQK
ncbi:helix-turn-helix domain-containing protein [Shumkonia mesophila]|uniref:helix-turn-helix domain-containing protein n=1 Tax=Shumkonia mesophila TaxID=2838854 RepID=UPI0029342B14|nr:helix-turn-helix transcriptional regulator [Shumkonia mesophila]